MKQFIQYFLLTAIFVPQHVLAKTPITVISDIDDTIRISNVQHKSDRLIRATLNVHSFTGMKELYQSLLKDGASERFIYLTAAPEFLNFYVEWYLRKFGFPKGDVVYRPSFSKESTLEYKVNTLNRIFEILDDDFILIGDDTQFDPEAYSSIYFAYPHRVQNSYIHSIKARKLDSNQYPFVTAFDIAKREVKFKRLAKESAILVAQTILDEKKYSRVLPKYQKCPNELVDQIHYRIQQSNVSARSRNRTERTTQMKTNLEVLDQSIMIKIKEYCEESHLVEDTSQEIEIEFKNATKF